MWNLKSSTNEHIYKSETDSQTKKTNLRYKIGKGRKGKWEYVITDAHYHT